MIFNNL